MSEIVLSIEAKDLIVKKAKEYFYKELDQDLGGFDAVFLIDFFSAEMGPHFYNQGLRDAHLLFSEKTEEIGYLVQELEKPSNHKA